MATKKATYQYDNGSGWDEIMFKTTADQVVESSSRRFVSDSEKSKWNGKAEASHTHSYLPLSGGTINGNLGLNTSNAQITFSGYTNSYYQLSHSSVHDVFFISYKGTTQVGFHKDGSMIPVSTSTSLGSSGSKFNNGYFNKITTTNLDVATTASFGGQIKVANTGSPNTLTLQGGTNSNQAVIKFGDGARIYSGSKETRLIVEGGIYTNKIIEGADIRSNGSMYPTKSAQGGWDIGLVTNRFYTLYAVNTNLSSDKNMKEDIVYLDDEPKTISLDEETSFKTPFKDFICNDLKVATYKYKRQNIVEGEDGTETIEDLPHQPEDSQIGFIAQDIKDTEIGSMFVYGEEGNMNYSPSGFTTVIAKALQEEIKSRDIIINEMTARIDDLTEKLNKLMTKL